MLDIENQYRFLLLEKRIKLLEDYVQDFIFSVDSEWKTFEEFLEKDESYNNIKNLLEDIKDNI